MYLTYVYVGTGKPCETHGMTAIGPDVVTLISECTMIGGLLLLLSETWNILPVMQLYE